MKNKKTLRKYFTHIYYNTKIGRKLIHPLIVLRDSIIPEELALRIRFKRMLGYTLNLKVPKTFNEKIQWLKLNDRSNLHIVCADKYEVRFYVKELIGEKYLIPLVHASDQVESISPSNLPDFPFIIKTNNSSGFIQILHDKNKINYLELREKLKIQLNYSYAESKGEWQYRNIKPMIIVEKLLTDKNGGIPSDYKLHCFNGRVKIVQIHTDRFANHKVSFYSSEWEMLPITRTNMQNDANINKPYNFLEMKNVAEKLAAKFIYVRVDLYNLNNKIYFGELTFHPASGFGKFIPELWDIKLGDMLKLPIDK